MSQEYTPEQIERAIKEWDETHDDVHLSMLRAYAATLRQPAARVDVTDAMVSRAVIAAGDYEVAHKKRRMTIDESQKFWKGQMRAALEAALSAQPALVDPTDPGYDVEVLREQVRHLERRIRELSAQPAPERQGAVAWRFFYKEHGQHVIFSQYPQALADNGHEFEIEPMYVHAKRAVEPDISAILSIVGSVMTDHGGYDLNDEDVRGSFYACLRDRLEETHPAAPVGVPDGWRELCLGLIRVVEGYPPQTWRNGAGARLKDTPEWCALYVAATELPAAPSAPQGTQQGEGE